MLLPNCKKNIEANNARNEIRSILLFPMDFQ